MEKIVVFREVATARGGGGWRWRRVARNGKVKYTSGERFHSKANAVRAARAHSNELNIVANVMQRTTSGWLAL